MRAGAGISAESDVPTVRTSDNRWNNHRIEAALATGDLFVSIGTSDAVYPAAGFVQLARAAGAHTLELNLEPSAGTPLFHEARHGPAGVLVPAWVEEVLGGR